MSFFSNNGDHSHHVFMTVENLALGTTCYVVHHVPRRLYQVKCGQPTPTTRMGQHIAHANTTG